MFSCKSTSLVYQVSATGPLSSCYI